VLHYVFAAPARQSSHDAAAPAHLLPRTSLPSVRARPVHSLLPLHERRAKLIGVSILDENLTFRRVFSPRVRGAELAFGLRQVG